MFVFLVCRPDSTHLQSYSSLLVQIFKSIFTSGKIPCSWSHLTIHLCCLFKILELGVSSQFAARLRIIISLGYRAYCAVTAAAVTDDDTVNSLNKKQPCCALFVDLSKAFDTISNSLVTEFALCVF